ncbi:nucleotide sugar dehydrogenase [Deltaproteobacteria bacterium IMCC39524]|nr:nucleotide sugar dehydrogenase [Deltaproteobacteria bacterium IMCC39524]
MRVSIFGLGYVGVVSAGCLSSDGHYVVGVDNQKTKIDMIESGHSPIIEPGLADLIKRGKSSGNLKATEDVQKAISETDISLICVGTPCKKNGSLNIGFVGRVCEEIGSSLSTKSKYHVVVLRSTVLPGTMKELVIPTLEKYSGKKAGEDFGVCNNPEFLREGTAVHDYNHPPKTVIGQNDSKSGKCLAQLYKGIDAPLFMTDMQTAEMVKYADNSWHALKVAFANEIGAISKANGIDSHVLMDIFCSDMKLNISTAYLKPGFAFGGSCLPKDLNALVYLGKTLDIELPLLNSIMPSNKSQINRAINIIEDLGSKKVGFLGISFKDETDDLRESPTVAIVEHLIGKGYDLRLYDRCVNLAKIFGANKDYILNTIPHISNLMVNTIEEVINHGDTVVISSSSNDYLLPLSKINNTKNIFDLVRLDEELRGEELYEGICW